MKPTWQDETGAIRLFLGDCRQVLPVLIADGVKVDLLCTDPPYGLGYKLTGGNWSKRVGKAAKWDTAPTNCDLSLITCFGDDQIIWGGNYFQLRPTRCWLGWIKRDAVETCANLELAWTSFDACSKYFDYTIAATNAERCLHPTIKPLALMQWCLGFAPKARTVIDPYMGSGSTGIACLRTGRSFIGIEMDADYFQIAVDRIQRELAQPRLPVLAVVPARQEALALDGVNLQ